MARVGVVVTLVVDLQAKKSIFISGAVRLTKKQFNVMINKSVVISKEIIGEYCGALPHGTVSYSAGDVRTAVYVKGIRKYHYSRDSDFVVITIDDGCSIGVDIANKSTNINYRYMDYNVVLAENRNSGLVYVQIKSNLRDETHVVHSEEVTILMLLSVNIPDYIKEPIRKLQI